jgi:hypothetical protein
MELLGCEQGVGAAGWWRVSGGGTIQEPQIDPIPTYPKYAPCVKCRREGAVPGAQGDTT